MNVLKTEIFDIRNNLEDYRLDVYLAKRLPEYSRTLLQKLIKDKMVKVNGKNSKASHIIKQFDHIEVTVPMLIEPQMIAEEIFDRLPDYRDAFKKLLEQLKKLEEGGTNDSDLSKGEPTK